MSISPANTIRGGSPSWQETSKGHEPSIWRPFIARSNVRATNLMCDGLGDSPGRTSPSVDPSGYVWSIPLHDAYTDLGDEECLLCTVPTRPGVHIGQTRTGAWPGIEGGGYGHQRGAERGERAVKGGAGHETGRRRPATLAR